jgi:hypothetical protein
MKKTPEHDKLHAVKDESQVIGTFLDWLQGEGMCVAQFDDSEEQYWPVRERIEQLLAKYFDIDLVKLEKEKVTMLEELRKKNEKNKKGA